MTVNVETRSRIDFAAVNEAARRSMQAVLSKWLPQGRRSGHEWVSRNPRRNDRSPGSFSVSTLTGAWSDFATGDKGGDIVSLIAFLDDCSQGDAARKLADELGVETQTVATVASVARGSEKTDAVWRPIVPVPADAPPITNGIARQFAPQGFSLKQGYRYDDSEGRVLGHVARFERHIDGCPTAKEFRPFVWAENAAGKCEWRCQGLPTPRPLYGLRLLAERRDETVLVVEGEKAAHAALKLMPSMVVVTSPNGSKSARKADWSPLVGRRVVIWPDADEAGALYAADVNEMVTAAGAATVRIVILPPELPEGWDLADALPDGLATIDLLKLVVDAKAPHSDRPLPLYPLLPPAERFPIEALGPVLSKAAASIARKVQVPEAIAGQSVLAAAALAAQAHADVLLPYGQTRPLSLFFVTVAGSGDRKSTADNEALWPVVKYEKLLREESQRDMASWRIAQGAWAAEKKKIEGDRKLGFDERKGQLETLGEEPPRPLAPFLISGDLTIEGLTKNWHQSHAALGVFTAEAGQFTSGHAMGEDNRLKTAAMLSELWDGKPVKRVRALDGVTILPGRRLSAHLMVQPDAAAAFLGNATLRDQGLLSRVMVAAPSSIAGTRLYRDTAPEDDAAIRAYGARILSILETAPPLVDGTQNELDPRPLTLTVDAADAWRSFYDHVERQCAGADGLRPIVDFAAKAAEHAARIAGVMTIVADIRAAEIDIGTMSDALVLADWYVSEQLRLQQGARTNPKLLTASILLNWLHSRSSGQIDFREIIQLGPSLLRTKQAAEESIVILIAHGWMTEISARPRKFKIISMEGSA